MLREGPRQSLYVAPQERKAFACCETHLFDILQLQADLLRQPGFEKVAHFSRRGACTMDNADAFAQSVRWRAA